jgi:hypothetical protein
MSAPARVPGPDTPPPNEARAVLWVVAVLLATLELTWWLFNRMFSGP